MMQVDLVKSAQQGNALAIAQLMSAALEPRGINVTTRLEPGCLHIYLTSEHRLNREALVTFTRSGLLKLAIPTLQTVKLSAQMVNQQRPLWVEVLHLQADSPTPSLDSSLPPTPASPSAPHLASPRSPLSLPPVVRSTPRRPLTLVQRGRKLLHHLQLGWTSQVTPSPYRRRPQAQTLRPYRTAGMMACGAFLVGGVLAVLAHLHPSTQASDAIDQTQPQTDSTLALSQPEQDLIKQQADAKNYLAKMNQAQVAFYQDQGKFAPNLEELERSAAILFPSYGYTFKLLAEDGKISRLLAYPRSEGLKGMIAVVVVPPVATDTSASRSAQAKICMTDQAVKEPPSDPQIIGPAIQCPAGSSEVP